MKKLIFIFFYTFISLFAEEVKVLEWLGTVKIFLNSQTSPPEKGKTYPENIQIITKEKSNISIFTRNGTYIIKENASINVNDLLNIKDFIPLTVTHVSGVRGIYSDLQNQLKQESKMAYENLVRTLGGKIEDYNGWKTTLDATFLKLIKSSGRELIPLEYAVLRSDMFNAMALPGGQFIILTKTLDTLDNKVSIYMKQNKISETEKPKYRELFVCGILAHELAHYYNQHALKMQNKFIGKVEESELLAASKQLEKIDFSQEQEMLI